MSKTYRQSNKTGKKELEPGLITKVDYVRAVDGDTIEFSIKRTFKIRLRDIDVYEKNTELGQAAIEYVNDIMSAASDIIIFIPSNDPEKFMDINSFERIVGDVYINGQNLSEMLRRKQFEKNGV